MINNIYYDNLKLYILFLICATVAGLGPIFIKQYINSNNNYYIGLSGVMYLILIYSYYLILQRNVLGITYNILKIISIMIVTIISIVYYKEVFTKYQVVGFVLGLISIYLLGYKNN